MSGGCPIAFEDDGREGGFACPCGADGQLHVDFSRLVQGESAPVASDVEGDPTADMHLEREVGGAGDVDAHAVGSRLGG